MRYKISKALLGTRSRRALLSNFSYMTILQVANYALPLVTLPYLARVIGADGFGKIAFAAAIIMLFQTFSEWGFRYSSTRDAARCQKDHWELSQIFSRTICAQVLLMIVALLILIILIFLIPIFMENAVLLLITFMIIPFRILFAEWFFQAVEKMKYIALLNLIVKAIFTALVFLVIKDQRDYLLYPALMAIGYLCVAIISMYIIINKWGVEFRFVSFESIKDSIKDGFDIFTNSIVPNLYNNFSIVLVGAFVGPAANGVLDAARRFSNIGVNFSDLLAKVFFPFLSKNIDRHNFFALVSLLSALLIAILLFMAAPFLINQFFTEEFESSILLLRILSVFVIAHAVINVYGFNFLLLENREKRFKNITLHWSVVGFFMAFPLVKFYGATGAAMLVVIVRGAIAINVFKVAREKNLH